MARRSPGEGQVFFSEAKGVWIFRARVGYTPDGRYRYREGRGKSKADASRKLKEAERVGLTASQLTVGQYLKLWLDDVVLPNLRAGTHQRYEQVVRLHIAPKLGGQKLDRLTPSQVTHHYAELHRAGVKPGMIRKVSEVLATAMEQAVREGRMPFAPTHGSKKPRVDSPAIEVFTDDEVKRILSAATGHRLYALFAMAVGTGMRSGELLALEWGDVAPDCSRVHARRTLTSTGKGHKVRSGPTKTTRGNRLIDLPAFAMDALLVHRPPSPAGRVFPAVGSANPVQRSNLRHQEWRPLLKAAGVPYRKFHTTRHTAASRLLAAGVDVVEVARILGDRPEVVLKVYAQWIPGRGREAADKLDAIYRERGPNVAE